MELAVIYARVSTTDQAQNGISLQAQTLNCRRYAEVQNLKVIGVEVDILSAKNTKRPALQRVMKLVHNKKVQHLISSKQLIFSFILYGTKCLFYLHCINNILYILKNRIPF